MSSAAGIAEQGFQESAGKDRQWNWKFRVLKADISLWQSKVIDVLTTLAASPPPDLASGEFSVRAKAVEGMALAFLKHHEDADIRFREADELASNGAPYLRCEVALFRGNQAYSRANAAEGDATVRQTQYLLAMQRFEESLQLAQQYRQPYIEAGALIGISITTTGLGHFDQAIEASRQSLDFAQAHQYELAEKTAILNLGWSYAQLGDLEKALKYFLQDLSVIDKLGQPKLKELVFNDMGQAYLAQGNYSAAREAHLKALAVARELDRNKSSNEKYPMVFALSYAADAALEEGKLDEAEAYSREATTINPIDPLSVLTAAKIALTRHNLVDAKSGLQKILNNKEATNAIRWDAEDEWAKFCVATNQKDRADRAFQKLIDDVEETRSGVHVVENRLAFSSYSGRYYDDYVHFLVATGERQKAFQVAEFSRARTLQEGVGIKAPVAPGEINIARIQSFLRQNKQVILSYWLAADQSYVWFVSPSDFQLVALGRGGDIERSVEEYSKLLLGVEKHEELERQGQALYAALIGPVEKLLPKTGTIVIIPDGRLSKLNFETLRVPNPAPHYWIEDVEMEVASSSTLLINSKKRQLPQREQLLLVGNPLQANDEYLALTHAKEELERIQTHFPANEETVISGKDAKPSIYKMSHPERFRMIHFVTHGTAHELSPLESAIILSPEGKDSFKLYARDIVDIPINADIVTISACYGMGKRAYSGEGLVGLAWAFLRAGAHQVVAGLWDVDDRASVELMDDFYTDLPNSKSASAALRAAKLKMVRSSGAYRRPYYWAPLQVYTGS